MPDATRNYSTGRAELVCGADGEEGRLGCAVGSDERDRNGSLLANVRLDYFREVMEIVLRPAALAATALGLLKMHRVSAVSSLPHRFFDVPAQDVEIVAVVQNILSHYGRIMPQSSRKSRKESKGGVGRFGRSFDL